MNTDTRPAPALPIMRQALRSHAGTVHAEIGLNGITACGRNGLFTMDVCEDGTPVTCGTCKVNAICD